MVPHGIRVVADTNTAVEPSYLLLDLMARRFYFADKPTRCTVFAEVCDVSHEEVQDFDFQLLTQS